MSDDKNFIVRQAQLKQLLDSSVKMLSVSSIAAILLAYVERNILGLKTSLIMLGIALVTNGVRAIICRHYFTHPNNNLNSINFRIQVFRLGVLVSSLIWGYNSYLVFQTPSLEHHLFMIYMLTGMSAGAIIGYSIERISAIIYLFFSLTPALLMLITSSNHTYIAMGVAGYCYALFATASIFNFNLNLTENVLLKYEADQREHEIKQIAFYDVLTSLPNRRLLQDRLQHALVVSKRYGKSGALLFIDLDKFKLLNDTHGHEKGDFLLQQVAQRLKNSVRQSDTVSRFGGDEFVVMLENLSEDISTATEQTMRIANNLLERLKKPYQLDDIDYFCSPSIGIAMFDAHGNTDDALLRNADTAMYQAKKSGGNVVKMYLESTTKTSKKSK